MIYLTAAFQAKSGKESELEETLLGMMPETAKETGTLEYRLHKSQKTEGAFFFYEKYSDQAALDVHLESTHYKTLVTLIGPMLASEPIVDTYKFIEGIPE